MIARPSCAAGAIVLVLLLSISNVTSELDDSCNYEPFWLDVNTLHRIQPLTDAFLEFLDQKDEAMAMTWKSTRFGACLGETKLSAQIRKWEQHTYYVYVNGDDVGRRPSSEDALIVVKWDPSSEIDVSQFEKTVDGYLDALTPDETPSSCPDLVSQLRQVNADAWNRLVPPSSKPSGEPHSFPVPYVTKFALRGIIVDMASLIVRRAEVYNHCHAKGVDNNSDACTEATDALQTAVHDTLHHLVRMANHVRPLTDKAFERARANLTRPILQNLPSYNHDDGTCKGTFPDAICIVSGTTSFGDCSNQLVDASKTYKKEAEEDLDRHETEIGQFWKAFKPIPKALSQFLVRSNMSPFDANPVVVEVENAISGKGGESDNSEGGIQDHPNQDGLGSNEVGGSVNSVENSKREGGQHGISGSDPKQQKPGGKVSALEENVESNDGTQSNGRAQSNGGKDRSLGHPDQLLPKSTHTQDLESHNGKEGTATPGDNEGTPGRGAGETERNQDEGDDEEQKQGNGGQQPPPKEGQASSSSSSGPKEGGGQHNQTGDPIPPIPSSPPVNGTSSGGNGGDVVRPLDKHRQCALPGTTPVWP